MVKGARQREWPRHLSTHTHTHWTLPTTMSVLETPFDIHVSSVYQTHTCMQAPIPTLCISAKKTHIKGSRTQPIMSTLMPRSGIPVICSQATLSCDSSYCICENKDTDQLYGNLEADQRLCFRYTDSAIPLLPNFRNFKSLTILCGCPACFLSDQVRNPEDRFSHNEAHIGVMIHSEGSNLIVLISVLTLID